MIQQLVILGILQEGEAHAYKLNGYVNHTMASYTDITKSTVYYTLEKLEKDGFVKHETEQEGRRPERRVYQITDKGKTLFRRLLRENLGGYTRSYFDDDIGVAFMGQLSTKEVVGLLTKKRNTVQSALHQFEGMPDHGQTL